MPSDFLQEVFSGKIVFANARVAYAKIMPMISSAASPVAFGKRADVSFPKASSMETIAVADAASENGRVGASPGIECVLFGLKMVLGTGGSEPLQFLLGGSGQGSVQVEVRRHPHHVLAIPLTFDVVQSASQGLEDLPSAEKLELPGEVGIAAAHKLDRYARFLVAYFDSAVIAQEESESQAVEILRKAVCWSLHLRRTVHDGEVGAELIEEVDALGADTPHVM